MAYFKVHDICHVRPFCLLAPCTK